LRTLSYCFFKLKIMTTTCNGVTYLNAPNADTTSYQSLMSNMNQSCISNLALRSSHATELSFFNSMTAMWITVPLCTLFENTVIDNYDMLDTLKACLDARVARGTPDTYTGTMLAQVFDTVMTGSTSMGSLQAWRAVVNIRSECGSNRTCAAGRVVTIDPCDFAQMVPPGDTALVYCNYTSTDAAISALSAHVSDAVAEAQLAEVLARNNTVWLASVANSVRELSDDFAAFQATMGHLTTAFNKSRLEANETRQELGVFASQTNEQLAGLSASMGSAESAISAVNYSSVANLVSVLELRVEIDTAFGLVAGLTDDVSTMSSSIGANAALMGSMETELSGLSDVVASSSEQASESLSDAVALLEAEMGAIAEDNEAANLEQDASWAVGQALDSGARTGLEAASNIAAAQNDKMEARLETTTASTMRLEAGAEATHEATNMVEIVGIVAIVLGLVVVAVAMFKAFTKRGTGNSNLTKPAVGARKATAPEPVMSSGPDTVTINNYRVNDELLLE